MNPELESENTQERREGLVEQLTINQEKVGDLWAALRHEGYSEGYPLSALSRFSELVHKWELPREVYEPTVIEIAGANFGFPESGKGRPESQYVRIEASARALQDQFPELIDTIRERWADTLLLDLESDYFSKARWIFGRATTYQSGEGDKKAFKSFVEILDKKGVQSRLKRALATRMLREPNFVEFPLDEAGNVSTEKTETGIISAFLGERDLDDIGREAMATLLRTLQGFVLERANETEEQKRGRQSTSESREADYLRILSYTQTKFCKRFVERFPPDRELLATVGLDLPTISRLKELVFEMPEKYGNLINLDAYKPSVIQLLSVTEDVLEDVTVHEPLASNTVGQGSPHHSEGSPKAGVESSLAFVMTGRYGRDQIYLQADGAKTLGDLAEETKSGEWALLKGGTIQSRDGTVITWLGFRDRIRANDTLVFEVNGRELLVDNPKPFEH